MTREVTETLIVPENLAGRRLDRALADLLPEYSRSRIKQWILDDCVHVDGQAGVPKEKVTAGQTIAVSVQLERSATDAPEPIPLSVVHEDADLIVLDKPAGLVVHPGAGNPDHTLVNGLLFRYPALAELPRAGIVHRLDKDTSGLIAVAASLRAHTALVQALQERRVTREYLAVCAGVPVAGTRIDAPVGRHPTVRTRMAVSKKGKPAVTHFRVLERYAGYSLLIVRLETGRTHQIRVHLSHIKHAILGDREYARMNVAPGLDPPTRAVIQNMGRQALHASALRLAHPATGEPLAFASPLPADIRQLVETLRCSVGMESDKEPGVWPAPA
jgi:23S rRNA pseudouridine1911/1915/1917 synthase